VDGGREEIYRLRMKQLAMVLVATTGCAAVLQERDPTYEVKSWDPPRCTDRYGWTAVDTVAAIGEGATAVYSFYEATQNGGQENYGIVAAVTGVFAIVHMVSASKSARWVAQCGDQLAKRKEFTDARDGSIRRASTIPTSAPMPLTPQPPASPGEEMK
jgi:hypothetical protein